MPKPNNHPYSCTMEVTLDVIGGKWKSLILWRLAGGTLRFNELRRLIPQATQKMLTQRLRDLERDGLVHRKVFAEAPPRVEYSLTKCGESLIPLLQMMCQWGQDFLDDQEAQPQSCV